NDPAPTAPPAGTTQFGAGRPPARPLARSRITLLEGPPGRRENAPNHFPLVSQAPAQVDPGMSQLITDLRDRRLLDTTLVIWMGEFGRTPRINQRGAQPGRDHYPRAWSSVMFGGGIRGGQVIGRTDAEAATVTERPVSTLDFMATVCRILGIDYNKQNQSGIGRPVRIVDRGANPITQLI